jgi:hypothetical protein
MEENKEKENKCCGGNSCCCCCGCSAWLKKHPGSKKVIAIILIIVAFCLGMAIGDEDRRDFRNYSGCARFMKVNLEDGQRFGKMWQDEVTVKVQPEVPVTPPVVQ